MVHLRLLTFDVKDTLLRIRGNVWKTYGSAARANGIIISDNDIKRVYKQVWLEKRKQYPDYGVHHGMSNKDWWHMFTNAVFSAAGYKGTRSDLDKAFHGLYSEYATKGNWELMPNARETLDFFKSSSIRLGIVSNFDERLDMLLHETKLDSYFSVVVSSWSAKTSKPDPEIFRHALRAANVDSESVVHVGDDLDCDYLSPRKLGILSYLYNSAGALTDEQSKTVDRKYVIKDLMELKCLVKS